MIWVMCLHTSDIVGGKGFSGGQEKDWMNHLKGGYVGLWNEVRRVAKGCS